MDIASAVKLCPFPDNQSADGKLTQDGLEESMPALSALSSLIEKRSLNTTAADTIRQAIVTGAVAPGVRLTETSLASRMGLSRGTIRSALLRLVTEGLVVQRPYARWEVASLTSTDAWELYTLRAALEALAARLAAETIDEEKGPVLEKAFDRLRAAADSDDAKAITDADLALHKTIVSMSGHRRLVDQYALVEQQVRMYIASTNARLRDKRLVVQEHEGFVRAVLKADADSAERLAREHSLIAGNDLVAHLRRQEQMRAHDQQSESAAR